MSTNWADVTKNLAPIGAAIIALLGIGFGASLSRRASAGSFLRERIFHEMEKRREVAASFRKALWVFSARVRKMRRLAEQAAEARKNGENSELRFDLVGAQACHDVLLERFVELELRATMRVQVPARKCVDALASSFNLLTALRIDEAAAAYAFFTRQYEELSIELNKEADHFNAIIYSSFTSIWRAILSRAQRKPLPYKVQPQPIELQNPDEHITILPIEPRSRDPHT